MVPALGWEPRPCGPVRFENHLQVVNPGDQDVELTLMMDPFGGSSELLVDGKPVRRPARRGASGRRAWMQIKIAPSPQARVTSACRPQLDDVFFTTSGPVAVYGSVVDRTSQDPRTTMPIQVVTTP